MPEGDRLVANGDLLRCDKGALVTPLTVLQRAANVHGRYQATSADCLPLVNVKPFGVCAVTHGPCMPPTLLWTRTHPGSWIVDGALPLVQSSVCRCALGGNISITVLPVPGMVPVGPEAAGAHAFYESQQRQQAAKDAEAHALADHAKEQAGKLALLGLACALGGLLFPPLEIVAAVVLEVSEAYLVAGVAIDVAVAAEHPTQDNWVTVGGDVLAIAAGYTVGKVIIGPALGALAQKMAQRAAQKLAAEAEAALAAEAKQALGAAEKAQADKIAAYKAKQNSPEGQAEKAATEARKAKGAEKARLKKQQKAEADAARRQIPVEPSRTQPSGAPDQGAKPGGRRAKPEGNAEKQRSIQRENEAADQAARAGYRVEQQPNVPGSKNPDYRIEGKVFDCYAPKGDNLATIGKTMSGKVADGQTRRLLINLDDAPGTSIEDISTLSQTIKASSAPELEEVLVWKNGQFHHVYP